MMLYIKALNSEYPLKAGSNESGKQGWHDLCYLLSSILSFSGPV